MKNCLFGKDEFDLLSELRNGRSILPVIREAVEHKYAVMGGQFGKDYKCTDTSAIINRSMISIGG
jgi:cyclic pyranopterin phosphate synthase